MSSHKMCYKFGLKSQQWAKGGSVSFVQQAFRYENFTPEPTHSFPKQTKMVTPLVTGDKPAPGNPPNAAASLVNDEDKDIAIAFVGEHRHHLDPAIEARVVRKIDLFLVPAMTIGYGLVYYDKVHRNHYFHVSSLS
jgi:hypothetical protein